MYWALQIHLLNNTWINSEADTISLEYIINVLYLVFKLCSLHHKSNNGNYIDC
jgi:hypothetical protein